MKKYDVHQKNCIILPIYVYKNLGNMCGMVSNGVGPETKIKVNQVKFIDMSH